MTSEKFDELANVIADKAAQKIRNMDSQTTSNVDKSALRNLDKIENNEPKSTETTNHDPEQLVVKDSRSDEKTMFDYEKEKPSETKVHERNSINHHRNVDKDLKSEDEKINYGLGKNKERGFKSKEKFIYSHDKKKYKSSRSDEKLEHDNKNPASIYQKTLENIEKVDTETFLQNYMASKELELNFKHLKGKLEKHRFDVKENDIKFYKDYYKNKHNEHDSYKTVEKNGYQNKNEKTEITAKAIETKKEDSNELMISDGSDENKPHEQTTFHDTEDIRKYSRKSKENKSTNDSGAENEEKKKQEFKLNQKYNSEGDIQSAKALIDKIMDKVSQELNNSSYSSKEVFVAGVNRAHSDELERNNSHSQQPQGNSMYAIKTKHRMEENEKLSKLMTSAEYGESRENAGEQSQPKFINTYK